MQAEHIRAFDILTDILLCYRRGSVVVDFELIFREEAKNPLEPLNTVAKHGKLGNMTFEIVKSGGR